jgi:serine/threonine protein kinase
LVIKNIILLFSFSFFFFLLKIIFISVIYSLAGRYPFDDKSPVSEQAAAGIQFPEKRFKHYSADAIDLVKKLMIVDPFKRMSIDDALNHPFFTSS